MTTHDEHNQMTMLKKHARGIGRKKASAESISTGHKMSTDHAKNTRGRAGGGAGKNETPETPECQDDRLDAVLSGCLDRLARGDDRARDDILELCNDRLRELSHRLLGKFARVRRWDDTQDVAQNAALRLYRALAETVPETPRGFMGLLATQIQRELIDLARKHSGPLSYAQNHDTNFQQGTDGGTYLVNEAEDHGDGLEEEIPLERWESFHAAVENLPEEHREVFKFVWYLGVDQKTAAETLGMSLRTVARRWQEARAMVTQAVGSEESS